MDRRNFILMGTGVGSALVVGGLPSFVHAAGRPLTGPAELRYESEVFRAAGGSLRRVRNGSERVGDYVVFRPVRDGHPAGPSDFFVREEASRGDDGRATFIRPLGQYGDLPASDRRRLASLPASRRA